MDLLNETLDLIDQYENEKKRIMSVNSATTFVQKDDKGNNVDNLNQRESTTESNITRINSNRGSDYFDFYSFTESESDYYSNTENEEFDNVEEQDNKENINNNSESGRAELGSLNQLTHSNSSLSTELVICDDSSSSNEPNDNNQQQNQPTINENSNKPSDLQNTVIESRFVSKNLNGNKIFHNNNLLENAETYLNEEHIKHRTKRIDRFVIPKRGISLSDVNRNARHKSYVGPQNPSPFYGTTNNEEGQDDLQKQGEDNPHNSILSSSSSSSDPFVGPISCSFSVSSPNSSYNGDYNRPISSLYRNHSLGSNEKRSSHRSFRESAISRLSTVDSYRSRSLSPNSNKRPIVSPKGNGIIMGRLMENQDTTKEVDIQYGNNVLENNGKLSSVDSNASYPTQSSNISNINRMVNTRYNSSASELSSANTSFQSISHSIKNNGTSTLIKPQVLYDEPQTSNNGTAFNSFVQDLDKLDIDDNDQEESSTYQNQINNKQNESNLNKINNSYMKANQKQIENNYNQNKINQNQIESSYIQNQNKQVKNNEGNQVKKDQQVVMNLKKPGSLDNKESSFYTDGTSKYNDNNYQNSISSKQNNLNYQNSISSKQNNLNYQNSLSSRSKQSNLSYQNSISSESSRIPKSLIYYNREKFENQMEKLSPGNQRSPMLRPAGSQVSYRNESIDRTYGNGSIVSSSSDSDSNFKKNPNINSNMNPNFKSNTNPNFNTNMNPNFNSKISPNFNSSFTTSMNSNFNSNFNSSYNSSYNSNGSSHSRGQDELQMIISNSFVNSMRDRAIYQQKYQHYQQQPQTHDIRYKMMQQQQQQIIQKQQIIQPQQLKYQINQNSQQNTNINQNLRQLNDLNTSKSSLRMLNSEYNSSPVPNIADGSFTADNRSNRFDNSTTYNAMEEARTKLSALKKNYGLPHKGSLSNISTSHSYYDKLRSQNSRSPTIKPTTYGSRMSIAVPNINDISSVSSSNILNSRSISPTNSFTSSNYNSPNNYSVDMNVNKNNPFAMAQQQQNNNIRSSMYKVGYDITSDNMKRPQLKKSTSYGSNLNNYGIIDDRKFNSRKI